MKIKTLKKSRFVLSFVLCAMGLGVCLFAGCSREEKPVPPPHTPESYMNDEKFVGKLAEARKQHVKLVREGNAIAEKMKAKVEAVRARLKTTDDKKVLAELEKDPEWVALYKQCLESNDKIKAQRKETLKDVRGRLTPPSPTTNKQISK